LAAILCVPITNLESGLKTENNFDRSTIEVLDCGVDLINVRHSSIDRLLPQLLVLTSQPGILQEKDISTALDTLDFYLNNSQHQVLFIEEQLCKPLIITLYYLYHTYLYIEGLSVKK